MTTRTGGFVHLQPADYDVIGPERFGQPGLIAVESVGPGMPVQRVGPLFAIHDSTFEPHAGIGHHPHQGMERLFYILEGAVDHDDAQNGITGHMGTGDLGILTEGRRGMRHSEWNHTDGRARCWILVYPCRPLVETAGFDAIRAGEMPVTEGRGVRTRHVVQPGDSRLHGDIRLFADSELAPGASMEFALRADEAGVAYVLEGAGRAVCDGQGVELARGHTLLLEPGEERMVEVTAAEPARVLHVVTGAADGIVHRP